MSTSGTGISPAAPDHSEKRSTSFDAASSRLSSVISVVTEPVLPSAGSFFSAVPGPGRFLCHMRILSRHPYRRSDRSESIKITQPKSTDACVATPAPSTEH